ncbi:hypothetical protein G443_003496 [Actinoalloteichus cyanogriseus DSM 43889]|uniref:Uncharacterized protein n=1 Tax=Actinoalloteichus caeruleus DSM 43889 TaxID=1120930 RepID=A0ABT1JM64_ACTCY|nr:hypothetical protein [Actinoalloteichus caeruleus DSM 43889]
MGGPTGRLRPTAFVEPRPTAFLDAERGGARRHEGPRIRALSWTDQGGGRDTAGADRAVTVVALRPASLPIGRNGRRPAWSSLRRTWSAAVGVDQCPAGGGVGARRSPKCPLASVITVFE